MHLLRDVLEIFWCQNMVVGCDSRYRVSINFVCQKDFGYNIHIGKRGPITRKILNANLYPKLVSIIK